MSRYAIACILLLSLLPTICTGMGEDHKPGDLPIHEGWPDGVYVAVNQPNRVHGYWINSSDTLFYKGANAQLQKMALSLSRAKGVSVEVVIHVGAGVAKSPWSKDRVDTADWSVTIAGNEAISKLQDTIRFDVWPSGNVTLDDLRFPPSVAVRLGGEIESFIRRHREPNE